jgi:Mce-associated membrane protein
MTSAGEQVAEEQVAEGAAPAPAAPARPRSLWRVVIAFVAVLALAASTSLAVVYGLALRHKDDLAAARTAALDAARKDAGYLTSYDYRTVKHDFELVRDNATASFKSDFAHTSAVLEPTIVSEKAIATGTVTDVAIERATTNSATVLAFVDQQVVTAQGSAPRKLTSRLRMTLVREHGRWLVSAVDLV